jgi:hypothetical protein
MIIAAATENTHDLRISITNQGEYCVIEEDDGMKTMIAEIFGPEEMFHRVDGGKLSRRRLDSGISIEKFSEKCGWPIAFQRDVEKGRVHYLTLHQVNLVKTALLMLRKK